MNTTQDISKVDVGTVIENKSSRWTVMGTPVFSHTRPGTDVPVYKVSALWEGKGDMKKYPAKMVQLVLS